MAGKTLTERLKALQLEKHTNQGAPETRRRTLSNLGRRMLRRLSGEQSNKPSEDDSTAASVPGTCFTIAHFGNKKDSPPDNDETIVETPPSVSGEHETQTPDAAEAEESLDACDRNKISDATSANWEQVQADETPPHSHLYNGENCPKGPPGVEKVEQEFLNISLQGRGMIQQHEFISKHTPFNTTAAVRYNMRPGCLRKEQFKWHEKLGSGTYGEVFLVRDKATSFPCAAKICWKCRMASERWLQREVKIHSQLDHPHIIKLYDHWQNQYETALVLEYAPGGSLYDYLQAKACKTIEEHMAAKYILQLALALQHLHSRGIIHRDVKSDNILIAANGDLKLCDFGWAVNASPTGRCSSMHGTLDYRAPEAIERNGRGMIDYDNKIDIWALGCLLFEMLAGYCPFYDTDEITPKKIVQVDYAIPPTFSNAASELIKGILVRDPMQRLTLEEIVQHAWILEHTQPQHSAAVNGWRDRFQNIFGSPEDDFGPVRSSDPDKSRERRN